MTDAHEADPEDCPSVEDRPGDETDSETLLSFARDLDTKRLLREARGCLDEVIADIRGLEAVVARYKAWIAVPAEFLRAEHDRVA